MLDLQYNELDDVSCCRRFELRLSYGRVLYTALLTVRWLHYRNLLILTDCVAAPTTAIGELSSHYRQIRLICRIGEVHLDTSFYLISFISDLSKIQFDIELLWAIYDETTLLSATLTYTKLISALYPLPNANTGRNEQF